MARLGSKWIVIMSTLMLVVAAEASEESTLSGPAQRVVAAVCPLASPHRWHLPHPDNCSLFVKCSPALWGHEAAAAATAEVAAAAIFYCSAPLHFNAHAQVCDWPSSAGCHLATATEATTYASATALEGSGMEADNADAIAWP